jgi:hypothetical protein
MTHKLIKTENYLLVVDDSEIKEGDYYLFSWMGEQDIQMFKDQEEDRENHKHFYNTACKKIIAHLPLKDSPILEGVALLPPYSRHQDDGLEELAEYYWKMQYIMALDESTKPYIIEDFKAGYNKAREKYKYTEDDVRKAISVGLSIGYSPSFNIDDKQLKINNIIQSLHQYPTEFECELVAEYVKIMDRVMSRPKTITTAQGIQWVGKYL